MNKYKKLLNNSVLFAIGNLGSKLITILMVPFYTYELSTTQFGDVDLITTTVNMFLPIISLSAFDAVLRFVMDKKEKKEVILTNALFITLCGSIFFLFILLAASFLKNIKNLEYLYLILVSQVIQSTFSEYARAIGKIKLFALNGILGTFVTAISNIILIHNFKLGIDGYLISMIVASFSCIVFLYYKLHLCYKIQIKYIKINQLKKILKYSIPLIPNALSWWATNASNRYIILFFLGMSANGLFAVANKIPSILSILNSIFFQSWQLSAIEEFESDSKDEYYTNIFSAYIQLLFICTSGIIFILRIFLKFWVSSAYYSCWKIVPFLLLSVIYSSISSFLGTNYIAAKKTVGVMTTTFIGAIINVIFCLLFIPYFGVNGAGIASALSFLFICVYRLRDTQKFVRIKIDYFMIFIDHIIFILQYCILFAKLNLVYIEFIEFIVFAIFIILNKKIVVKIIKNIIGDKNECN